MIDALAEGPVPAQLIGRHFISSKKHSPRKAGKVDLEQSA